MENELTVNNLFSWLTDIFSKELIAEEHTRLRTFTFFSKAYDNPRQIIERLVKKRGYKHSHIEVSEDKKLYFFSIGESRENNFEFYFYETPKTKVWLLLTLDNREGAEFVAKEIAKLPGIMNLWIPPQDLEEIMDSLKSEAENFELISFVARKPSYLPDGKFITPGTYRYWGEDADKELEKVKKDLFKPFNLEFNIKNNNKNPVLHATITCNSKCTLHKGDFREFFTITLKVIEKAINRSTEIVESNFERKKELIEFDTGQIEFTTFPEVKAIEIVLTKIINLDHLKSFHKLFIEGVVQRKENQEANTGFIGFLRESGNPFFAATIIDTLTGARMEMTASNNSIVLTPVKEQTPESILRFYRLIVEELDEKARPIEFTLGVAK